MQIGIIAAMKTEGATLGAAGGKLWAGTTYTLRVSGPGQTNARHAAQLLLRDGCDALLCWGVAGALNPRLGAGTLVLAESIATEQAGNFNCDRALNNTLFGRLQAAPTLHRGRVLSLETPLMRTGDKKAAGTRMNAIAIDMESAAVARTAQASGVGFAAVRAISDEVDFDVPAAALAGLNDDGSTSAAAVLTALCKQPREFRALLALARRFQRAEKSLRQAARWLQDT